MQYHALSIPHKNTEKWSCHSSAVPFLSLSFLFRPDFISTVNRLSGESVLTFIAVHSALKLSYLSTNPKCTFVHISKGLISIRHSLAAVDVLVCAGLAALKAVGVARWTAQLSDWLVEAVGQHGPFAAVTEGARRTTWTSTLSTGACFLLHKQNKNTNS